jgi:OmpA-OmpF porin, OOP family
MKKLLYIFLFFSSSLVAQNLVPNYSFEQYIQCPFDENQVAFSIGWKSYYATPDYFNACATNPELSVPYNFYGSYQPPANGVAYSGFYAYWSPAFAGGTKNFREHIGRQLLSPLTIGQKYFASFKVSLVFNTFGIGKEHCATNNLGIKFSTVPYDIYADSTSGSPLVNNFAHIHTTSLITDTINWTLISGSFVADSSYDYFIIGNFFTDANTDTVILLPSQDYCYAYYYIDDICISTDSLTCGITSVNKLQLQNTINIYPNPFSNSAILEFSNGLYLNNNKVALYDMMGNNIRNYEMKGDKLKIERNGLSQGVYLIKLDNYFLTQKLLITN